MSTLGGVNTLSNPYSLQSLLSAGAVGSGSSPASAGKAGSTGSGGVTSSVSSLGQLWSNLQQLETQNPAEFKQLTGQISTELQSAAQQQGSGSASQFLTNLANKFKAASTSGELPQMESHHGHHGHHAEGTYDSQGQSVAPSSVTSATGSTTSSSDAIQQLFASINQQVQQAIGS